MPMKITIQENITLAPLTTFKIGGLARFFVEVSSEEELVEALQYAKDNNLQFFILGGGSNILVSDEGFDGLVISMQDARYKIQDTKIECGAGLTLSEIVRLARENSLTGLEWAAGIPGTIGGAIRGNAGIPSGCMADSIESVRVIEISNYQNEALIANYKLQDCKFVYRDSIFKHDKNKIILSCVLKLKEGDAEEINKKVKEIIEKRSKAVHPNPKEPSSGSFFKNPKVSNLELMASFEKDTGQKVIDGKIPAGWLIDEVGLRGKKMGGVMVSEKHGNFVINLGAGKAQDVVVLASLIKMKVRNQFGVQLKEEIQYVGF
jgi:UDP-N-acetylmuramate dehydrogenase